MRFFVFNYRDRIKGDLLLSPNKLWKPAGHHSPSSSLSEIGIDVINQNCEFEDLSNLHPSFMLPPKQFETSRLFARIPRLDDAEPVFEAYAQDSEVTRYLIWKPYTDVESLRDFFLNCIRNWAANASFPYMLCLKGTDVPIGSIHMNIDNSSAGFGYVLAKPYWGKSLLSESLSYLVDWALTQPEIYRAWAFCDVENPASARVMEKAGMVREGLLRRWHICPTISEEPRDCLVFSKVR